MRESQLKKELKAEESLKSLKREMERTVQNTKNLQQEFQEKETDCRLLEKSVLSLWEKVRKDPGLINYKKK